MSNAYKFPHIITRWRPSGETDLYGNITYEVYVDVPNVLTDEGEEVICYEDGETRVFLEAYDPLVNPERTAERVLCRFEKKERTYLNEYGQHERSSAFIYTDGPNLRRGDIVIQGDYINSPTPVDGAFEVKNERAISNLRGTRTEYRYTL